MKLAAMAARTASPPGLGSMKSPMSGGSPSSTFRPARLGITTISEDPKAKAALSMKKAKSASVLPKLAKTIAECQETYGTMSAKARGAKIHNGPLELRKALPGRDCSAWVREDKQYSPYSYFDHKGNPPAPKPKKSKGPPPLWLPTRAKEAKTRKLFGDDGQDTLPLGAEAGGEEDSMPEEPEQPVAGAALVNRPPWDSEHHILFSRANEEVQQRCREYFDRPIRKESEGVPRVREQYIMHDRQCCWNDEPGPMGEKRRTLYDNIGPVNIGGCKEQQLPSYWRKIKDWKAFSADDLHSGLSVSKTGRPKDRTLDPKDKLLLLKSLSDLPADKAKEFWRGWAEGLSPGALPPKTRLEAPRGWDDRWSICWSRANDGINQRQREYFSVPAGGTGVSTSPARPRKSMAALGRAAAASGRFKDL